MVCPFWPLTLDIHPSRFVLPGMGMPLPEAPCVPKIIPDPARGRPQLPAFVYPTGTLSLLARLNLLRDSVSVRWRFRSPLPVLSNSMDTLSDEDGARPYDVS